MIGAVLDGRYRILSKLGAGAMGEVYLAEHLNLRRKEALKILQPALAAAPEFVARFRREARAANRVQHPNIVSVFDFGKLPDGRFYLSMEYADGVPLSKVLAQSGSLPVPRALAILSQLADAVHHAHAGGVIHRDLKPDNLVLTSHRGRADVLKVIDFGVSKIIDPDYQSARLTATGDVLGTPLYMAPEQFMGEGTDPRIDIYSVGCIAYEMLLGEPPFIGRTMEVMSAHLKRTPPAPSAARAEIPRELDDLVLRCLRKDRAQRFASGGELLAALQAVPGYRPHATGTRRSERFPVVSDDRTAEAALPAPRPVDVAFATTGAVDPAALKTMRHRTLRALCEALIDLGHADHSLLIGTTHLKRGEDEILRCDAELAVLDARASELEQSTREREGALRFALGELRFGLQGTDREAEREIRAQVSEIESRLASIRAALDDDLRQVTDRAIELTAARSIAEDGIDEVSSSLEALALELSARHAGPVVELAAQLRLAR
jgi:hypothetical protein